MRISRILYLPVPLVITESLPQLKILAVISLQLLAISLISRAAMPFFLLFHQAPDNEKHVIASTTKQYSCLNVQCGRENMTPTTNADAAQETFAIASKSGHHNIIAQHNTYGLPFRLLYSP